VSVALLLVIGQLLYTLGWSSRRVRDVCGHDAGPFVLDHCHIGLFSLLPLLPLLLLLLLLISVFLHPSAIAAYAVFILLSPVLKARLVRSG